jgi:hypothetical protein
VLRVNLRHGGGGGCSFFNEGDFKDDRPWTPAVERAPTTRFEACASIRSLRVEEFEEGHLLPRLDTAPNKT